METSLTAKEVSEKYGILLTRLHKMRHENVGPRSYLLLGRIRYDQADIDTWIKEQKEATYRGGVTSAA